MNKWDVIEFSFNGKSDGNPFLDYDIYGEFINKNEVKRVSGFYNDNGKYVLRFMPSFEGIYDYKISGSFSDEIYTGTFNVEEEKSHGMVRAVGTHFNYSDGTPYYSIGTTCYAWTNQTKQLQKDTIETLRNSAFNKIRFCIFPKHYDYNFRNPESFPYKGTPVDNSKIDRYNFDKYTADNKENDWDFSFFNVEYFNVIDENIKQLMELGIEVDIILMHPYDRWGFSKMPDWANDLYIKYIVARFSAYRNVWWSIANEYDLCKYKELDDWEHYATIIKENDAYAHLLSIHNCAKQYDFNKPWITHCSIQRQAGQNELDYIPEWIKKYNKPIVIDEMCYEGNAEHYWGNISGEEMLRRMWKVFILGAYPGHSECYINENIWWSHGGKLYGESYKRLSFLLDIIKSCGALKSAGHLFATNYDNSVKLYYFGEHRPSYSIFTLEDGYYQIEVIDTWNMKIEDRGIFTGTVKINLPSCEYIAIKLTKK